MNNKFAKNIFTKSNVVIIILLIIFTSLAIYIFLEIRKGLEEPELPRLEREIEDLRKIKEDLNFTSPDNDEVQRQLKELEELKK